MKKRTRRGRDKPVVLRVAVNAPLARLFDYLPPAGVDPAKLQPGCRLLVPFGRRRESALLVEIADHSELPMAKLRHALALIDEAPILAAHDLWLIRFTSDYYHHPIGEVVAAALPALLRSGKPLYAVVHQLALSEAGRKEDPHPLRKRAAKQAEFLDLLRDRSPMSFADIDTAMPGWRRIYKGMAAKGWLLETETREALERGPEARPAEKGPPLSADQSAALTAIRQSSGFCVSLLDGVTGSGKTEVYLRLIEEVLEYGRQALVLVPEIGLTPQLVTRFGKRLGFEPLLLHSALSDSERLSTWRAAAEGSAPLIIGTRSAVFVPLKNPASSSSTKNTTRR